MRTGKSEFSDTKDDNPVTRLPIDDTEQTNGRPGGLPCLTQAKWLVRRNYFAAKALRRALSRDL